MPDDLTATVRGLADRAELGDLVNRYLLALDDGAFTDSLAASVFSADVALDFPPGSHRGLAGVVEFNRGFMGHWIRTHHHASNYAIELAGDAATIAWNVTAVHMHPGSPPPPQPGKLFHLGGRFDGTAVRTTAGWRLNRLALRVIWTDGPGIPSIAKTMDDAREKAAALGIGTRKGA